jgi:protein-S-isoprenylcysteine O-methyltransferase Ste14
MKSKRILPPAYLAASLIAMALLHFLMPVSEIIVYPWILPGIVPLTAWIALNLIADKAFNRAQTTVKPFERSTTLITTGVFQICRHPMYLGMVLILSGLAIFMGSLTPFIVIVIFAVLMEVVFIRTEEQMLAQQFGEVWNVYTDKVRKWV